MTDDARPEIQVFDNNGQFLRQWGTSGEGDGEFLHPTGIVVDQGGNVYVSDFETKRIQKFSPAGDFLISWTLGDGGNGTPEAMAIGPDDNLYVTDYTFSRIEVFSPDGESVAILGTRGTGPAQFLAPVGIAFDERGRIYVTDQKADRVQRLTLAG